MLHCITFAARARLVTQPVGRGHAVQMKDF
jgi:hypothetical protein